MAQIKLTNNAISIKEKVPVIIWLLVLLYIGVFFILSNLMHISFYTGYDLAGAEQGIWQIAFNKDQFNTLWGANNWANRMYVFNLFLGPLYRLWPATWLLFLLQSIALGIGGMLLYKFAVKHIKNSMFPLIITIVYCLYPMLHHINLFDFHPDVFAIPFLLGAIYFAMTRPVLLFLFSVLAMMCKEDVAITAFAIGIYLIFKGKRWRGVGLIGLSIAWSIVTIGILMPIFNGGRLNPSLQWFYGVYGNTPGEILTRIFTHPFSIFYKVFVEHRGLEYLFKVCLGLGFLPLLAPDVLAITLPHFLINFVSEFTPQHRLDLHYGAYDIPVLFIASIIGYKRLYKKMNLSVKGVKSFIFFPQIALLIFAIASSIWLGPFRDINKFLPSERSGALHSAINLIPSHASVSASECIISHLAKRDIAYMFPNPFQRVNWTGRHLDEDYALFWASEENGYDLSRGWDVEYIIVDRVPPSSYYPFTDKMKVIIEELIATRRYGILLDNPYVLVLKKTQGEVI